jgi:hypothetical protein
LLGREVLEDWLSIGIVGVGLGRGVGVGVGMGVVGRYGWVWLIWTLLLGVELVMVLD